uniref:Negative elongation factor complex member A n=1 Tax=Ovis aries TaxID=9940 RepID=A0AC11EJ12_SHEEP
MASMRESDTGLWLHNKLGATDELWAPPSIASLLTAAVIDNIRLCFHGLSSAVKLKLLLGTLHLPRRTVDEKSEARLNRDGRVADAVTAPPQALQ